MFRALVHKDSWFRLLRALVNILDYWCIMETTDDLLLLYMIKVYILYLFLAIKICTFTTIYFKFILMTQLQID